MGKHSEHIKKMIQLNGMDELGRINNKQLKENEKEYEKFSNSYDKGECYICGKDFKIFSSNDVCLHNLLRRGKGFKNKNFKSIYEKWGYFQLKSFLSWCSAKDKKFVNINNLESEKDGKKFQYTIKWNNIKWTFSCSNNDFLGHTGSNSDFPHYHFQMEIDNQIFIKFSQFHIPFTDYDLFNFDLLAEEEFQELERFGPGMQDLLDVIEDNPEKAIDGMLHDNSGEEGPIGISTFISAKPGMTIDGNLIGKLFDKQKATGKTFNSIIRENEELNSNIQTIVYPNEKIVNISSRKGGRGKNK